MYVRVCFILRHACAALGQKHVYVEELELGVWFRLVEVTIHISVIALSIHIQHSTITRILI